MTAFSVVCAEEEAGELNGGCFMLLSAGQPRRRCGERQGVSRVMAPTESKAIPPTQDVSRK